MTAGQQAALQPERRFAVRIRIAVPPEGLGSQLAQMIAWLDANCGANSWSIAPSGTSGVVNDALAIYCLDPAVASAFVSRWCLGYRVETTEGAFRIRTDAPAQRVSAPHHRTP